MRNKHGNGNGNGNGNGAQSDQSHRDQGGVVGVGNSSHGRQQQHQQQHHRSNHERRGQGQRGHMNSPNPYYAVEESDHAPTGSGPQRSVEGWVIIVTGCHEEAIEEGTYYYSSSHQCRCVECMYSSRFS